MWKVESFLKYRKITLCWQIHHELGDKVMKVLSEHIVVSDLSFYLSYYQPTYLQWKNGMGWRHIRFRIVHFLDVVEFLKPKNCLSYNNYQCNTVIIRMFWEVVVVQLLERSLLTPEVRGSNPVIGKIYMDYQLYWKDENKEKRGRERPNFIKKKECFTLKRHLKVKIFSRVF